MSGDIDFGNLYDADSDDENQNPIKQQQQENQPQPQDQPQTQPEVHYGDGIPDLFGVNDVYDVWGYQTFPIPTGQQPPHNNVPVLEEPDPYMGAYRQPADQIHYQQVMGGDNGTSMTGPINTQAPAAPPNLNLGGMGMNAQFEQRLIQQPLQQGLSAPQPPEQEPTEHQIMNSGPGVQIGSTRFPNLAAARTGAGALEPPYPGPKAHVFGTGGLRWTHSMVDRYPYYDDGPQADGEGKRFWMERVINARDGMGIIRRQEPPNMDLQRPGETNKQTRKRRNDADYQSKTEDMKHKWRLDPKHKDYDERYTRLWQAQQDRIRAHNAAQRATWLRIRREFDRQNDRVAGPDPIEPDDGGDDLYDFTFYRLAPRTVEGSAGITPQNQQGSEQARASAQYKFAPTTDRCLMCRRHSKGCDLQKTGFPCTNCEVKDSLCEDGDNRYINRGPREVARRAKIPANQRVNPGAPTSSMSAAPTSARPRRRDPLPARRSASPERGADSKCDNCTRYGTICEDTRPCRQCIDKALPCDGKYQGNAYTDRDNDAGASGFSGDDDGFGIGFDGSRSVFGPNDLGGSLANGYDPVGRVSLDASLHAYSDTSNRELELAANVAQPEVSLAYRTRATANSFGVGTELARSSSNGSGAQDNLAPFTEQRRLVSPRAGVGGTYELPHRPAQVLRNAARASATYTEPADDTRTLAVQSARISQNAAGPPWLDYEDIVETEIFLLREAVNNGGDFDLVGLHSTTIDILHASNIVDRDSLLAYFESNDLPADRAHPESNLM
jgi:hypothetical protein